LRAVTITLVLTYVLKSPQMGLAEKTRALNWIFYVVLPNLCFADAIQNIYMNYQALTLCAAVEPYCKLFTSPNPCCPGQSTQLECSTWVSWHKSLCFQLSSVS